MSVYRFLAVSLALVGLAHGQCPKTADECVNRGKFNELKQEDPGLYCEEGPKAAAEAQNCLYRCGFPQEHSYLQQQKNKINAFCKTIDPKCDLVCDTFINQTRCFDKYGGLGNITAALVREFTAGQDVQCQEFHWARYCQRVQNCSFNQRLDVAIIQADPEILLSLAICRSETLKDYLPSVERTDGCSADLESTILKQCNVSCDAANAKDGKELCGYLQKQAACLEQHTAGCTSMERRLVLPRLNSYAVANKHLYCDIKYYGIPVRSGRTCEYSDLINTCLLTKTLPNTLNFFQLQPLFNLDTLVMDFCKTKGNQQNQIISCRNAFQVCVPVQAMLLQYNVNDAADFLPQIGIFPLDNFGMKYIYNVQIPSNCPKTLKWSDRICIPIDNKRDINDGEEKTTVHLRSTPIGHETPTRNARASTPKNGAGDFERRTFASKVRNALNKRTADGQTKTCSATRN